MVYLSKPPQLCQNFINNTEKFFYLKGILDKRISGVRRTESGI